jgi:predicted HTH domain antitoxin
MTATTSIEISKDILRATRMTTAELKVELAITLFQGNKLSFGKAREMAEMDVWTFQQLLGSRGISPHYDISDYEEDLDTISEME